MEADDAELPSRRPEKLRVGIGKNGVVQTHRKQGDEIVNKQAVNIVRQQDQVVALLGCLRS